MKIKDSYTREDADFMSIISSIVGENPDTFQGDEAFWGDVSVDFEGRELSVYNDSIDAKLLYTLAGAAHYHNYAFSERFI